MTAAAISYLLGVNEVGETVTQHSLDRFIRFIVGLSWLFSSKFNQVEPILIEKSGA